MLEPANTHNTTFARVPHPKHTIQVGDNSGTKLARHLFGKVCHFLVSVKFQDNTPAWAQLFKANDVVS